MLHGITLVVLGVLAAPSLLLSRKPEAKELLDKIRPYQGWIGLIFCFLGVWEIIKAILSIGLLGSHPIWWITWVANSALKASLGFLLGYGMINKLILSKNETALDKGEELHHKLAPLQGSLGLIAIITGIWSIIAAIFF